MMEEEPVADMVRETYRIIRKAMDKGVADNVIPAAMARKLDNSAFLFSGFKTAQELKEASLLLREKDGTVKGFSRFLTDIRRIDANYNVRYLEAEYNFAVSSAQMAASWAEVSQDGDRYDLQYRTAGDDHVREEHRALNGVTLPPSNDFWRYYYPPLYRRSGAQREISDIGRQTGHTGRRPDDRYPEETDFPFQSRYRRPAFPAETPILQTEQGGGRTGQKGGEGVTGNGARTGHGHRGRFGSAAPAQKGDKGRGKAAYRTAIL